MPKFVYFVSGKSSLTCFLKSRPSSLAWQLWSRLCRVIFTTFTGNLYTFIQRSLALMLRRWRRTCEINVRRCLSQTQNFFMATRRKCPLSWVPNKGTQWNELTACLFFCDIHSSKILLTDNISFLILYFKKQICWQFTYGTVMSERWIFLFFLQLTSSYKGERYFSNIMKLW
jgi:hypothetical protein